MMENDDLDIALSRRESIVPSSGFVEAVMDAVRREAAIPPPIPFPWKRAMAGLAASLAPLLFLAPTRSEPARSFWLDTILEQAMAAGAGWIALALFLSLVSVNLAMRLTRRNHLPFSHGTETK